MITIKKYSIINFLRRCFCIFLLVFLNAYFYPGDSYSQSIIPTKGKEFWLGFLKNYLPNEPNKRLDIFITSDVSTSGFVSIPQQGWNVNFTVTANQTTTINIPNSVAEHITSEIIDNKGIYIQTQDTVSIFAINFLKYTADGSKILPIQSIGTEYRIMSYNGGFGSEFLIVATADNTQIIITPTASTQGNKPAGIPFTVNLNAGESYMVQASPSNGDFTGTTVIASDSSGLCRPFAVFTGNMCLNLPSGCYACDHLFEQELSRNVWGTSYYAVPFTPATSYSLRVLANENNTQYTINGTTNGILNAGQFFQITGTGIPTHVQTNKPSSVAQFMEGKTCSGYGDPAMVHLNDSDQHIDKVTFSTVTSTVITQHRINVIMRTAFTSQLILDGTSIPSSSFSPFPSDPLQSYAQFTLTQGSHTLEADSGFTAYAYGTGSFESYAYSVGSYSKTKPINIDSVLCSNDTIFLGNQNLIYNPWWSTASLPNDTLFQGLVLTLVPPISPELYILHGSESISQCPVEFYFKVENPDPPSLTITQSADSICKFQDVQLISQVSPSSSNYIYSWLPTSGLSNSSVFNPVATPNTSTWYVLSVTTSSGCSSEAIDSIFIFVKNGQIASLEVNVVDSLICFGDTTQLSLPIESLIFEDSFDPAINNSVWLNYSGTASAICGSYFGNSLYFNDAGIRQAVTNNLNINNGGTIRFALKFGTGAAPCEDADFGEDVTLSYSTNGGGSWTNIATYYENLYPIFTYISVPIPPGAISSSTLFKWSQVSHSGINEDNWMLDEVSISTVNYSGYVISWTPSNSLSATNIPMPLAYPTADTWYVGQVTDTLTGCVYRDSVLIQVEQKFTTITSNDTTLCTPASVILSAAPGSGNGHTFNWLPATGLSSPNSQNPIANPAASTIYEVTVISSEGCKTIDSISVFVSSISGISVTPESDTICLGDSLMPDLEIATDCGIKGSVCSGNSSLASVTNGSNQTTYFTSATIFSAQNKSVKRQLLYQASELITLGMDQISVITQIGFSVTNVAGSGKYSNFRIKMGCTGQNQTTGAFIKDLQTVFEAKDITLTTGINNFVFDHSFDWDGTSNLMIEICYENALVSQNSTINFHTTPFNSSTFASSSIGTCQLTGGSATKYRANTYFTYCSKDPAQHLLFSWNPTSGVSNSLIKDPYLFPSVTTSYILTVTDTLTNCSYTDSIYLNVIPNNMTIAATPDTMVCSALGLQLGVLHNSTTPVNYSWNPASNLSDPFIASPVITVDGSQLYVVTVTDSFGCAAATDSVQIMVVLPAVIHLTPDTSVCIGDSIQITATGGVNYSWTPAGSISIPSGGSIWAYPQVSTTYFLIVIDSVGCQINDSVFVDVKALPQFSLGPDSIACQGSIINLSPGSGYVQYLWNTGSTNSSIQVNTTGNYFVGVTDLNGCQATDSVEIFIQELPIITIAKDHQLCYGDSILLNATIPSGLNYQWSPTTGLSYPFSGITLASPGISTSYNITVWDTVGCYASSQVNVNVLHLPQINLGNDTAFCIGEQLVLNAGEGFLTYLWNNNSTENSLTVTDTGMYWVAVGNDCGIVIDTLIITDIYPIPVIDLGPGGPICDDPPLYLDAGNPGSTYIWSTGENTQTITPEFSGYYAVTVTNNHNCTNNQNITLELVSSPQVNLGSDTLLCYGDELLLDVTHTYSTYIWHDGTTLPQFLVNQEGHYFVISTNFCGIDQDTIIVNYSDCICEVYIPNAFTPNNDGLNEIFIPQTMCHILDYQLVIFNRWGQIVYNSNDIQSGWDGYYNGLPAPEDVYVYSLSYVAELNTEITKKNSSGRLSLIR
jgi:gliding motility-associated-like protein